MNLPLESLPVALDATSVRAALPAYRDFLAGRRALLPVSPDAAGVSLAELMGADRTDGAGHPTEPGTLIACTSGSTGTPKGALLRTDGVRAAISASASFITDRLGTGPGPWLLALPPHHIAGTMVILRSLDAGFEPAVLDSSGGPFRVDAFCSATTALADAHPGLPLYTSLVPTQLVRVLDSAAGSAVLGRYAAVLVGGGPTPPAVVARCEELGVGVLLTYGSSETSGGVLYNGEPLPGYSVEIVDPDDAGVGRVALHGPSVADGYRVTGSLDPAVAADAFPTPGVFRTSDLGRVEDGVLAVLGRADGAVNSGGLKILPEQVEAAVASVGLTCCAVGLPDDEWGEIVAVLVETEGTDGAEDAAGTECTASLRARMKDAGVSSHLIPRRAFTTGALPLTGPGKLDRQTVRGVLQELVRGTSGD